MNAPDSPPDSNAAPAADGRQVEAPAALSAPCLPSRLVQALAGRMAKGTLTAEEIRGSGRQLVRHLLRGCPDCAVAFGLGAGLPASTEPFPLFFYQAQVDRAIRLAMQAWRDGVVASAKPRSEKAFERERAKALIAEAQKLRREDPQAGLELLDEALRRAQKAEPSFIEDDEHPAELACEIHTDRANLFRLLGRHLEAELAFQSALAAWSEELGDPDALLHLGDLYGSFLLARRRFAEADLLLGRLVATFSARGDAAHAAKLAVKRTQAAHYANEPARAFRYSLEALALLRNTDLLELRLNAIQHNIVLNLEAGNFQEASDCADSIRAQLQRHMGESDRAKFLWLDAQIYDGLRRRSLAGRLFLRAKAQFEKLGLPFQAALVGLDLAVRLVERGRSPEARALIGSELIPTFHAIGVAREGIASFVLLERATEAAALDAALLKSVLRDLERAGQNPGPKRREGDEDDEGSDSA